MLASAFAALLQRFLPLHGCICILSLPPEAPGKVAKVALSGGVLGTKPRRPAYGIQVYFDPKEVSYEQLLDNFFDKVDPTTKDRQGNDMGTQYRSAIYYHNEQQKEAALKVRTPAGCYNHQHSVTSAIFVGASV